MSKIRLRDLGIRIGQLPPGPNNAITDVPGVLVGQTTLIQDEPTAIRTGVTAIFPRLNLHEDAVFAGLYSFNGIGEMTGLPFIEETGILPSPVILTNTNQVGMAYDALVRYGDRKYGGFVFKLPVVAETYDGWLNDIGAFPLGEKDVVAALESAHSGPVDEGNCGGGTGMICYEFKGGTGTASRQVEIFDQRYTVGALVQANHGERPHLMVAGVPVGSELGFDVVPPPWERPPETSSIVIVLATDAPLLPNLCKRLAQRATVGLARTGGYGLATSGDLFLAFSTGNHILRSEAGSLDLKTIPAFNTDSLVIAAAETVEEAILNSLVAAETMIGLHGRIAYALPHAALVEVVQRYHRG